MVPDEARTPEPSVPPDVGWHVLPVEDAVACTESDAASGLAPEEAARRLVADGPNALVGGARRTLLRTFLGQFADFMILVLLAAAVVSGVVGELADTVAIVVILVLNAVIGTVQAERAERAIAALRRMAAPHALARRGGEPTDVSAADLVRGDVVELQAGDVVPADLRLLEAVELQIDESALTGESAVVEKTTAALDEADVPLGDRRNMAMKSTSVTRGRGVGLVVSTGMRTEIGRIAALLATERGGKTPLQIRLARLGRYLAIAVLVICAIVFGVGVLQGQEPGLMFLTAVSLAVAAIPEALPAVVTVSLAFGAAKLARRQSLVRNLPAVETLGSVTVICSDKTGTLTQNRMTLEAVVVAGSRLDAVPPSDAGTPGPGTPGAALGHALSLSNDVELRDGLPLGDPTEVALWEAGERAGYEKAELARIRPRVAEIPFDSVRKRMTTVHRTDDGAPSAAVAYTKGAPEDVLPLCDRAHGEQGEGPIDRAALLAAAHELAGQGYRVLAIAERVFDEVPEPIEEAERALTFVGLVALIDPPRPEVPAAVAECRTAGITPVMITGDHPGTARAIAVRLGIAEEGAEVLTGRDLVALDDDALARKAGEVRVYARVSPEQKIRIVEALEARGEFVAMTGDGVNDAPALKRAAIGVAMGENGTDVAREAADMVLLDDNFATIVSAVREGRRIFDNIRKFIRYTMSSNSGEIWTLFLAPLLGLPVPLLPIHILWINLVTDGLPGLAFTAEPDEPGTMERPPRPPHESVFAHGLGAYCVWVGLLIGALSIASQAWAIDRGAEHWQTVVFTVLTLSQLFHSLAVRSERGSLLGIGLATNKPLLAAVVLTIGLQLTVVYAPPLQPIFQTQALPLYDLGACLAISLVVLAVVEMHKAFVRRQSAG